MGIQLRRARAIEFYSRLKRDRIIFNIEAGLNIVVTDNAVMVSIDDNDKLPEGATRFFVCEMEGKIDVSILRGEDQISTGWVNN